MERRELGSTGEWIPEIGLGTWQYQGGVPPLRRGLELGATFIDTAEVYGTEPVVGEAIRGQREKVILASKVSGAHLRYDDVLRAADESLQRLGVETIDLYQVHWPNAEVPLAETMRALETLADSGKIRYIGVSNFSRTQVEEAQAGLSHHRIASNQVLYSLLDRGVEADMEFYVREKITLLAYSPLAHGEIFSTEPYRDLQVLQRVAAESGKTVAQVALNWCLSHPPVIVIPKTDRAERVPELVGASGWQLTPEQVATLDEAFSQRNS
jgi:diketogulonate reductase-like aldo/keto reductase